MNRKVLVAAVAAAFVAPAAFAQSSVTVGGTIAIVWDSVRASGNTGGDVAGGTNNSLRTHDRVRDGNGSNIRFTVIEDLGGGNSAFVQVESAVIANSDTRADAFGTAGAAAGGQAGSQVWGNRNSGIGIRTKAAGRFLIGVWDVHYHEHYAIDPGWLPGTSAWSTLALTNNFGSGFNINPTIGARYNNTIHWDSPSWGGFSLNASYSRPLDGAPRNTQVVGDATDGKKNRAWSISPRYEAGGLSVVYSYLQDKDAVTNAVPTFAGAALAAGTVSAAWKVTGNRLGARYKFAFGLGIGGIWDSSKLSNTTNSVAAQMSIKRTVWAFPITYDTGNHHVMATYARARDWRGTLGGIGLGGVLSPAIGNAPAGAFNLGSDTGANFWAIGYMYNLSQRTNVSVGFSRIKNEALVRYDMFANSSGNTAVGGDPRNFSLGLRHTF